VEPIEVRMTSNGFPIIPKLVMQKELKKGEWEKLLRAFLTQHYCESTFEFHGDAFGISAFRSSQWTKIETGTLWGNKEGYRKLRKE
jgi:hypothetical protein